MSELRALSPVSTAFEKARKLLLEPFDAWLWVRLAIITFFVGSGPASLNPWNVFDFMPNRRAGVSGMRSFDYHGVLNDNRLLAIIALLVLAAILLALIISYLRSVFSFVLIESVTTGVVRIARPFKENMARGFRVFLFNILIAIVTLAIFIPVIVLMVLAIIGISGSTGTTAHMPRIMATIFIVAFGVLFLLAFSIIIGLAVGFVYDFALPLMLFKGMGLRQAIGRVYGLVKSNPAEFVAYVVVRWLLELAAALIKGIVSLFVLGFFFIFGLAILIAFLATVNISVVIAAILAIMAICWLALLLIAIAFISMPFQVYFRYYSLDFLRTFDPSYVSYTGRFS